MTTDTAIALADAWTALWNGAHHLAEHILTPDFRIVFGATDAADGLRGPAEFAAFVETFTTTRPGLSFHVDGPTAGDVDSSGTGRFAVVWHSERPGQPPHSGIDLFRADGGRIAQVWSVTGERLFPQH